MTNKRTSRNDAINDANGVTLTEAEDIKIRWVEYSTKLFDVQDHQQTYSRGSEVAEPPPLRPEVEIALHQMNNGKSPGKMIFKRNYGKRWEKKA